MNQPSKTAVFRDELELRRLRDDLQLMAARVQNHIDIIQSVKNKKAHNRTWFDDPLYRSCRDLGYSVRRQLRTIYRKRPPKK